MCTSKSSGPIGSFRAGFQRIHNSVLDDFGDSSFDSSLGDVAQEIELQEIHSHFTGAVIDLGEFPWAGGMSEQQAEPVASGGQRFKDAETHS